MLKSVAIAVAVSLSDVLPKVTSDELGGLEARVGAAEMTVEACPDLSIV
jgi:hypothetical protein